MNRIKMFFWVGAFLLALLDGGSLRAMESATIKSVRGIDLGQGVYHLTVEQNGIELSSRVDQRTTVALRYPAERIVAGDRVWINQNVNGMKGVEASIPLSPASSQWFGVPTVRRVARVTSFQKVPSGKGNAAESGMVDAMDTGIETVEAVEHSARGVTFVMKGGIKKRFFLPGVRLWKVVSPSGLKPGMVVQLDSSGENQLKHLLVNPV